MRRSLFPNGFAGQQEVVERVVESPSSWWVAACTNGFESRDSGDRNFVLVVGGAGMILTGGQCCRGVVVTS